MIGRYSKWFIGGMGGGWGLEIEEKPSLNFPIYEKGEYKEVISDSNKKTRIRMIHRIGDSTNQLE